MDTKCWHCGAENQPGAWVKWRYHTRRRGPYGYSFKWGHGWMCDRCINPRHHLDRPDIDGDGKPMPFQLVFLKRRPATRLLAASTHAKPQ